MNLSSYSRQDLLKLRRQIDRELESRRRVDQRTARQEVRGIAEKYGLSMSDLVGGASNRAPRGDRPNRPVYRHPADPNLAWAGRGRKPKWIKEWEASGKPLEQLRH
jgi:DNA-binding protein H-NS